MQARDMTAKAAAYNIAVLDQALNVLKWFESGDRLERYGERAGPHLRHILEHYEQFFGGLRGRVIDYDGRRRDIEVERNVAVARGRYAAASQRLARMTVQTSPAQVAVTLCGGLDGAARFVSMSTTERELLFLASHSIHHYAIIKPHLIDISCDLPADFGKAPATVRHERSRPTKAAQALAG